MNRTEVTYDASPLLTSGSSGALASTAQNVTTMAKFYWHFPVGSENWWPFASTGVGSMPHLALELYQSSAKVKFLHVPYRGAAPALTDLLGGQVQAMFADAPFRSEMHLSAVNSINLARVLAQCVYYLWAWLRLPASERSNVEFVVPTGNFGDILAGYVAKSMGLPIKQLMIATNSNDILARTMATGRAFNSHDMSSLTGADPWKIYQNTIVGAEDATAVTHDAVAEGKLDAVLADDGVAMRDTHHSRRLPGGDSEHVLDRMLFVGLGYDGVAKTLQVR